MKIDARRVEAALDDPRSYRVILLHGDDQGLISERAARLVRAVVGADNDPFRLAELAREEHGRLEEEFRSLSLTGGRRVVRIRQATDTITNAVAAALETGGDALLVVEAPGLAAKSRLRTLVERAADGAAIGCYPQSDAAVRTSVRQTLAELEVTADPDALAWVVERLGGDSLLTGQEAEKLALYAGRGGEIDLAGARASVGDLAGLSLDDALSAAAAGDVAMTDRALDLAIAEGATPVGLLRAGLLYLARLERARAAMASGLDAAAAMKLARPPVFFARQRSFIVALGLWSPAALRLAGRRLWEVERECKRTGAPDELLARNAILAVARRAAAARHRR